MRSYSIYSSWLDLFNDQKNTLDAIVDTLELTQDVAPSIDDIFAIFDNICLTNVRVVIIGQNPYDREEGQATGIAFAVNGTTPSNTLKVISEELQMSYGHVLKDMSLRHWLDQGVMLINRVFTTQLVSRRRNRVQHTLLWRTFINALLQYIISHREGVVFILLGDEAQELRTVLLGGSTYIVEAPFPIHRNNRSGEGFVGSQVFKRCNERLEEPIDW
jgi:uracil-DNA glycosylase